MRSAKSKERHDDTANERCIFASPRLRIPASPYPHARGFTLIELSIVIFIILIITSAAVPWMKTFSASTRLRSASRGIRSLMNFAQSCAITQRTEYVVLFDATQNEYWLSLLELLNEESAGAVIDSSRTSLSESIDFVTSSGLSEEEEEETEEGYTLSRTGGILGIPKRIAGGIQILQMISPRSLAEIGNDVDYVTFYPDGTAEDFEMYLQNNSGRTSVLTVDEATARIAIKELSVLEMEELGLEIIEE